MTLNYDLSLLSLESDDRGFVIGQTLLGSGVLKATTGAWTDIKGDFTSIDLSRTVTIDNGMMFRPEAGVLNLNTLVDSWTEGQYGKPVRLRYNGETLFTGNIKSVKISDEPGESINDPVKTRIGLTVLGRSASLNKFINYGWDRPQETAAQRAIAAWPDVVTSGLTTVMAATTGISNPSALETLQEVADAALARFYVDRDGTVTLDATVPGDPIYAFTDGPTPLAITGESMSLEREESVDSVITGVAVEAKSDTASTASRVLDGAIVTNEQRYTIDLPTDSVSLGAWVASFPLKGFTEARPVSMRAKFQANIVPIDLTDLVLISLEGREWECAIKSVHFSISPTKGWTIDYGLMPDHLVRHSNVVVPGPVTLFKQYGTKTTSQVDLSWGTPAATGSMSGYEIRYATGLVPPADRTSGTLAATVALGTNTYSHTGRASKTDYAYSIWSVTDTAGVESTKVTTTAWTKAVVPSVPLSVTATKMSSTSIRLTWAAPATGDYTGGYEIEWAAGAYSGGQFLPTWAMVSYTFTGLMPATVYTFDIYAYTGAFHSVWERGPGAQVILST